jgi:predicted O-methyltransferase YrrM
MTEVDYKTFSDVCRLAVESDEVFQNFKNNSKFTYMLEQTKPIESCEYFCRSFSKILIEKYGDILNKLPWIHYIENDMIGNPLKFKMVDLNNYLNLKNKKVEFSHSTLRYILYSLDIYSYIKTFYKDDGEVFKIVEVGSGYGGQCKILLDTLNFFNIKNVEYTLIDLPNVNSLSKKYLKLISARGNYKCIPSTLYLNKRESEYDLFISCFSLGEMQKNYQDDYIDNLVNYSKRGYIIWNDKFINPKLSEHKTLTYESLLPRFDRYVSVIKFPSENVLFPLQKLTSTREMDVIHDYLELINSNLNHFENLTRIVEETKEPLEESIMTKHFSMNIEFNLKQIDLYTLTRYSKNILNIGFNAGHSTLIMLLSNSRSQITCFDIMEHKYSERCYEYLRQHFPNRIKLVEGDSINTLHVYKTESKFDMVNINGSQTSREMNLDFWNAKSLSTNDAFVIWNNLDFYSGGYVLWEGFIRDNFINNIKLLSSEHLIGQFK